MLKINYQKQIKHIGNLAILNFRMENLEIIDSHYEPNTADIQKIKHYISKNSAKNTNIKSANVFLKNGFLKSILYCI